jgi:hypothetical protein
MTSASTHPVPLFSHPIAKINGFPSSKQYGGFLMLTSEQYNAIIIGSGEAGKWMAWHLGSQGQHVINIEDKRIGGACPNVACLPSKNVIHSAKVAQYFQRGAEFGMIHSDWHVDMAGVNAHRQQLVDGNLQAHLANYAKSHAEIVMGFTPVVPAPSVPTASLSTPAPAPPSNPVPASPNRPRSPTSKLSNSPSFPSTCSSSAVASLASS